MYVIYRLTVFVSIFFCFFFVLDSALVVHETMHNPLTPCTHRQAMHD